jgi:hypothetical protein
MIDIGAVEALALHDERLRPDHFLRGTQLHRDPEDLVGNGVREPFVVDGGDPVAGAVDDVDEIATRERLAEPVGKRHLRPKARSRQDVKRFFQVPLSHEKVEVLRVAADAGVARRRVRPAHEEPNPRGLECKKGAAVEVLCLGIETPLGGRGHG